MFSSPHGDFSFSIICSIPKPFFQMFSSPHGDFSFSMILLTQYERYGVVFVPSRGFLFFYGDTLEELYESLNGFRPLTGISLFLYNLPIPVFQIP